MSFRTFSIFVFNIKHLHRLIKVYRMRVTRDIRMFFRPRGAAFYRLKRVQTCSSYKTYSNNWYLNYVKLKNIKWWFFLGRNLCLSWIGLNYADQPARYAKNFESFSWNFLKHTVYESSYNTLSCTHNNHRFFL